MDEPTDVAVPEPAAVIEQPKPKQVTHRRLEFHAWRGLVLPHMEGGRYWHHLSRHVVPADEAAALLKQPGFREVLHG